MQELYNSSDFQPLAFISFNRKRLKIQMTSFFVRTYLTAVYLSHFFLEFFEQNNITLLFKYILSSVIDM